MKTWNYPTVITDIVPQTIPRQTIIRVKFDKNAGINFSGNKVNLKNMENGFGYEILASGQQYHSAAAIEHSNWLG